MYLVFWNTVCTFLTFCPSFFSFSWFWSLFLNSKEREKQDRPPFLWPMRLNEWNFFFWVFGGGKSPIASRKVIFIGLHYISSWAYPLYMYLVLPISNCPWSTGLWPYGWYGFLHVLCNVSTKPYIFSLEVTRMEMKKLTVITLLHIIHSLPTVSKIHSKTARTGVIHTLIYVDNQSPAGQQVRKKEMKIIIQLQREVAARSIDVTVFLQALYPFHSFFGCSSCIVTVIGFAYFVCFHG